MEYVADFDELVAQLSADNKQKINDEDGKHRSYHNVIDHPSANLAGDDLLEIRNHYVAPARTATPPLYIERDVA
jgi:hypothetical protein